MRLVYRFVTAIVFGCLMLAVYVSPIGQTLEREYGLPFLYSIRGDLEVPGEAMVIGLDNESVRWLNGLAIAWNNDAEALDREAPTLKKCLSQRNLEDLLGAANINHIPRSVHACLIDALNERKARLIAFDINFNKDRPDDPVLEAALSRAGNVLLFERFSDQGAFVQRIQPREDFRKLALGTMAFQVDATRGAMATSYLTTFRQHEDLMPMPEKAWTLYTGQARPGHAEPFQPIWLYGPPRSVPTVSLKDLFDPQTTETVPEDLSNVVVFIGSSDPEDAAIDDHFPVPTSGRGNELIGGVELAATAFLNRLHGTILKRPAEGIEAAIVFLVAFLGGFVVLMLTRWRLIYAIAVISLGYMAVAALTFSQALVWLPVAVPVFLTALLVSLAAISVRYFFARALVSRLAPRQIASMLLEGTTPDRRAVKTEHATVIFTDLMGSTRMGEVMDEVSYSDSVNLYYDTATDVIEAHDGMVVEFMGDGIVSLFSESVTGANHAAKGCAAARALVARLSRDNREAGDERPPLLTRMGINSGLTATGDIGARHRFQYKALGDVVNVAARLEQHGKTVDTDDEHIILVSETTFAAANLSTTETEVVGDLQLRGREASLGVYRLLPQEPG